MRVPALTTNNAVACEIEFINGTTNIVIIKVGDYNIEVSRLEILRLLKFLIEHNDHKELKDIVTPFKWDGDGEKYPPV